MVGVPRSKGCQTCRNRRVRCDEVKPTCDRCAKGRFKCLGYEREMLFRNTYTNQSLGLAGPSTTQISKSPKARRRTSPRGDINNMIFVPNPPPELDLSAFQWEICAARMFDNFIWRSYGAGWLDVAARGKLGDLSLKAVKAFSQFSFGQSNRARRIEEQGDTYYGECMGVVREKLQTGTAFAQGVHRLVCPILIMIMLACLQTDRNAPFMHLDAISRALCTCGPEPFQNRPLRSAFEAARSTLLMNALFARKKLFLEDHGWQTVPWALEPASSKRPQSHLLDIFVMIPGLLEEERRLSDEEDEEENPYYSIGGSISLGPGPNSAHIYRLMALRERVATQLERLYRWRWDWQHENGRHVATTAIDNDDDGYEAAWRVLTGNTATTTTAAASGAQERGLQRLAFSTPVHANDIMVYNAVLMWLIALLWKIDRPLTGAVHVIGECARRAALGARALSTYDEAQAYSPHFAPLLFEPLEAPGASTSIRGPAIEICRAYDWLARYHSGGQSATSSPSSSFSSISTSSLPPLSTSSSSPSSSSPGDTDQDQICLYLFPLGMARCVLEGAGARASPPSVLDPDPDLLPDSATPGSVVRDWIRCMLDVSPVTQCYGPADGSCNVVGFASYVTPEALYPPAVDDTHHHNMMEGGGGVDHVIGGMGYDVYVP